MKNKATIVLFCLIQLVITFFCNAQSPEQGLALAFSKNNVSTEVPYKPSFMFVSKNKILRYNPVSLTFGGLLFFYQRIVSPQISAECPYQISCSNFSKASIQRFGLIKGIALTASRLMRCCKVAAVDIHPLYFDEKGKIIDSPDQYTLK